MLQVQIAPKRHARMLFLIGNGIVALQIIWLDIGGGVAKKIQILMILHPCLMPNLTVHLDRKIDFFLSRYPEP
ncbi:hypothetical protein EVA_15080 [gut metagenome]|uniref:Uncharacterized protein n=1 Tax=gut metagenome TaxID=749906 RepID=J9FQQ1_9ZZZZ